MGLFNFNKKEKENKINWNKLTDISQLEEVVSKSKETPVLLFKHSTRCSISAMALNRIESNWNFSDEEIIPYYLDLIAHRDISGAIAEKFGVEHQSPQIVVVKEGESILDASHNEIKVSILKEVVV